MEWRAFGRAVSNIWIMVGGGRLPSKAMRTSSLRLRTCWAWVNAFHSSILNGGPSSSPGVCSQQGLHTEFQANQDYVVRHSLKKHRRIMKMTWK